MIIKATTPPSLHSFPSAFVRALSKDTYVPGTSKYSVTELLAPPQTTWLKKNHEKDEKSAYALFAALMGTAVHHVLELGVDESEGEIAEQRFYHKFIVNGESISVSGQVDLIEGSTVYDYKNVSGTKEALDEKHALQLQMNGFLAEENGMDIEFVGLVYIDRTWSYGRSTVDPSYAQTPWKSFVQDYDRELAERTFLERIKDHEDAFNGNPRPCTPDEQWRKPTTYALKKPEGKRASKVCDSYAEALEHQKTGQIIETRPGEATFCKSFCPYASNCPQKKKEDASTPNKQEP